MKILFDECLPMDLRRSLSTRDTHTVQWAGLKGRGNGELLQAAELAGYDVRLSVDEAMPRQHNPAGRKLAIRSSPRSNQSAWGSFTFGRCDPKVTRNHPAWPDGCRRSVWLRPGAAVAEG